MIGNLNHVAIAVPDLAAATAKYRDQLGAKVSEPHDEPDHGVRVVFVELPNTKIELLDPLDENSPINGFLAKNASGGIHHLCFEVDDIRAAQRRARQAGCVFAPQRLLRHVDRVGAKIKHIGQDVLGRRPWI